VNAFISVRSIIVGKLALRLYL